MSTDSFRITVGEASGPHFSPAKLNELRNLATDLYQRCAVNDFQLWYDKKGDWHNLEFDLDGHHYRVQFYKIKTLYREGEKLPRYLAHPGHNSEVVEFFLNGKHKEPWPQPKP